MGGIISNNREMESLLSRGEGASITPAPQSGGGIKWQRDFFDHRLRKDESYLEKAHYIRMNPVRAGLVEKPEDWPCVWDSR